MKTREFFRRWLDGIKKVTPLMQLRAKRWAVLGQVLGMLLALVVVAVKQMWYWLPFLFFTFVFLCVELVGVHRQVRSIEGWE